MLASFCVYAHLSRPWCRRHQSSLLTARLPPPRARSTHHPLSQSNHLLLPRCPYQPLVVWASPLYRQQAARHAWVWQTPFCPDSWRSATHAGCTRLSAADVACIGNRVRNTGTRSALLPPHARHHQSPPVQVLPPHARALVTGPRPAPETVTVRVSHVSCLSHFAFAPPPPVLRTPPTPRHYRRSRASPDAQLCLRLPTPASPLPTPSPPPTLPSWQHLQRALCRMGHCRCQPPSREGSSSPHRHAAAENFWSRRRGEPGASSCSRTITGAQPPVGHLPAQRDRGHLCGPRVVSAGRRHHRGRVRRLHLGAAQQRGAQSPLRAWHPRERRPHRRRQAERCRPGPAVRARQPTAGWRAAQPNQSATHSASDARVGTEGSSGWRHSTRTRCGRCAGCTAPPGPWPGARCPPSAPAVSPP